MFVLDNTMQDWELEVSDFLFLYQNELNSDDDKFTLMRLIVSSFDDGISFFDSETEKNWNMCKIILKKECYLHYSIIKYWSCLKDENMDDGFKISPYMSEI